MSNTFPQTARPFVALALLASLTSGLSAEDTAPPARVSATTAAARLALEAKQPGRARELILPVLTKFPTSVPLLQLLGVAEESLGHTTEALAAYGRALALAPGDDYSATAVRSLCRDGLPLEFPAAQCNALFSVLGAAPLDTRSVDLDLAPVLPADAGKTRRRAFHTTGVVYAPPAMVRPPTLAGAPPPRLREDVQFNRLCYGYVEDADQARWRLRFRVHYVSQYLLAGNQQALAEGMCDLLLRLYWLGQEGLALETRFAPDGVIDVWLRRDGEPGGEHPTQYTEDLFFWGINVERPGIEWIRQVAHEYGHHVIPPVDGYTGVDEPWATGMIGERLFLPWLQAIGFGMDGETGLFRTSAESYAAYAGTRVLPDARFFLDQGPSHTASADRSEVGWRYTHGFLTYVALQYGPGVLADTFRRSRELAPGDFMTGIDLLKGFQDVREASRDPLTLDPRLPIPSLTDSLPEIPNMDLPTVAQEGELAWWVYLPAGDWEAALVPSLPTTATLALGLGRQGGYDRSLVLSAKQADPQWTLLGTLATGWHVLRVRGTNVPEPFTLRSLRLRPPD